jgi:hypothetical protein
MKYANRKVSAQYKAADLFVGALCIQAHRACVRLAFYFSQSRFVRQSSHLASSPTAAAK